MDAANELSPILIVDDDVNLVSSMVDLFGTKGIHADYANSGREALAVLQSRQSSAKSEVGYYKAVLLDVMMESQSAGFDILMDIRRLDKNLPVIYVTATTNVERATEVIRQGAVLALAKPIPFQTLYYCILSVVKYAQLQTRFLQKQLEDANKQLVVDKLFNHSLKNLAFAGQTYLQLPDGADAARRCFAGIVEQTDRLTAMAREPDADDHTRDLAAVWNKVRGNLAGTPQLPAGALDRLQFPTAVTAPALHIKPETLAAVLGELVYNAFVHNTRVVTVTVTVAPVENGQVEIRVADDGAGVPAERRPGLFIVHPEQTHHGFGMPYCYQVARMHGGHLAYTPPTADTPGAFVLTLRAHQPSFPGRDDA